MSDFEKIARFGKRRTFAINCEVGLVKRDFFECECFLCQDQGYLNVFFKSERKSIDFKLGFYIRNFSNSSIEKK